MSAENETVSCLHIQTTVAGETTAHGNVGHILSAANRRLYPEDRTYRVRFKLHAGDPTRLHIYTLKPTWRVMNALRLAKEAWLNNTSQEFAALPKSKKPKWRTFRTYGPLGTTSPLIYPKVFEVNAQGIVAPSTPTNWEIDVSRLTTSDGAEKWLTLSNQIGGGMLGVFDEYAQQRVSAVSKPHDFDKQMTLGYTELDDDVDIEIVDDIADEGNNPPYPKDVPHGEQFALTVVEVNGTTNVSPWIDVPTGWFILNTPVVGEELQGGSICIEVKETSTGIWSQPIGRTIRTKGGKFKVVKP